MGSGADLKTSLQFSFLLSSQDMATLIKRSKDERTRNAALLRYTCGHDGRYFGLFYSNKLKVGVPHSRISIRSKVR